MGAEFRSGTTITYNVRGWQATVTDPLNNTTTYSYTATGQASTVAKPNSSGGSLESYYYDNADRLTTRVNAFSKSTVIGYDKVGNLVSVKDENNNITTYQYDNRDRVTTITDALSHATVIGYDLAGNRQTVKDALGNITTTLYDALNRATTILDPRGGQTTMAYDVAGRMTGLTDPEVNRTSWKYDSADRMTTMTDPLGNSATYVYNLNDEVTDAYDRNGRRTSYSYDSGGRLTGETWKTSGGTTTNLITYTYNAVSELTNVRDSFANLTFTYDSGGNQLTAATSGPGSGQPSVTLTSGYDQYHNRTSLADNISGNIGLRTFQYDAGFRLTSITTSYNGTAGPQVIFGYDDANRETSISRTIGTSGTAVNTTKAYDNANRLTTIIHKKDAGTGLATYVYTYDNANRVKSEKNAEGIVTYTYDSGGQLTGATGSRSESYSYDDNGNRTMTGYTTGTGNQLTASPNTTYTYDKEGNLTAQRNTSTLVTTSYTYDNRNRLTGVTVGGTVTATYTYDALNRRIGVKDSGTQTWTAYDGVNPYADFNSSGVLTTRYLYGRAVDEILARTTAAGTTAWYLTDLVGSVRDIANTSGSTIDHVIYDSYGKVSSESLPANGDRFKFTGRELDSATGLYFYRTRYYDPTTGRFLAQDVSGFAANDPNLYRYVGNNPRNSVDPFGLEERAPTVVELQAKLYAWSSANSRHADGSSSEDLLDQIDQATAGFASSITAGATDRIRTGLYGEIATRNQSGGMYEAGRQVGQIYSYAMMTANPCQMGPMAGLGYRALGSLEAGGHAANAYNATMSGDYMTAISEAVSGMSVLNQISGACLGAGTPILTPSGETPIEELKVGDWVMAAPEDDPNGPAEACQVAATFRSQAALIKLQVGDRSILTTAEHPFWVDERGWTAAQDLIEGDRLRSLDGRWIVVGGQRDTGETVDVFNLRISCHRTYFIGRRDWGFSVWVHNTCSAGSSAPNAFGKEKQALVDMAKYDKRTGMTKADMEAYKELNKQLPDPFPANKVRGPEAHPSRSPHSQQPHGHVGPVDHIPITDAIP